MGRYGLYNLKKELWASAEELRANSKLKANEYAVPVLGLIFLRFADLKFSLAKKEIEDKDNEQRRKINKEDYKALGVMYVPEEARFSRLFDLPDGKNIGKAINDAMESIEYENEELKDVLPKAYDRVEDDTLIALLEIFSEIDIEIKGDILGEIYEYFLGSFAIAEGQRGGEFFTPTSIINLMVEIVEPIKGSIYDPACGSGGMFVQSARFAKNHYENQSSQIMMYGQEKSAETARLCRMNMAVHGLPCDIRQGNTYYDNFHNCRARFDFVLANPPFNVDKVNKDKIKGDPRYPFGIPTIDNANYLWIQEFYSALNNHGRAGFVMANVASDARGSEMEMRKKLILEPVVDMMITIGSHFFHNVRLPCTLWFFDKGKKSTNRKDKVLFIDARSIYTQVDRSHRQFTPQQIEFLANIVRLYRGQNTEFVFGIEEKLKEHFPNSQYMNVPGLCRVATIDEIADQDWSLNPGRYVGIVNRKEKTNTFKDKIKELNDELELLNIEAINLQSQICLNIGKIMEEI